MAGPRLATMSYVSYNKREATFSGYLGETKWRLSSLVPHGLIEWKVLNDDDKSAVLI